MLQGYVGKILHNKITQKTWFMKALSGWPVGNGGINLYIGISGIHSLIPY